MKGILVIAVIMLFSCAGVSEQQKQAASNQFQVNLQKCNPFLEGYRNGINSYVEYVYCTNQAGTEYYLDINFPYPEIIPFGESYNLALAERVDAGEITPEQALRMYTQFMRVLIAQASQQRIAAAEREAAWRDLIRSLNTSYYLSRPITCYQNGPFITCN
jgi:hypothetical protein